MQALPVDFCDTLYRKFQAALESADLVYAGNTAKVQVVGRDIHGSTHRFHLTELQSLQQRPENGCKSNNPFEKPEPELTILEKYGANNEFRVLLNKFPVVPAHFMLVTKEFKSQHTPLAPSELLATFSILTNLASRDPGKKWFSFYNCGPASGASQPHKHVQFMTLPQNFQPFAETLVQGSDSYVPNQKREPLQDPKLPFAHFVAKLPSKLESGMEDVLSMTFCSLVQSALTVLADHACDHLSYNFCATTEYMMVVPRKTAKFEDMGVNSCGFMGMVLCKNHDFVEMTKERGFENVLAGVAFPNTSGHVYESNQY